MRGRVWGWESDRLLGNKNINNIKSIESEDEVIVDYIMDFLSNNKQQTMDKFDILRAIVYLLENMYSSYASSLLVMYLRGMTEVEASNMLDFIRKKYQSSKDNVFRLLLRELLFDLFAEPGNIAIKWIKQLDNIKGENKLFLKNINKNIE